MLIIYTPDGTGQTRVGNPNPGQGKTYSFTASTEIFVANPKQESFAMKGNDVKTAGFKPTFVLGDSNTWVAILLSTLN